MCNGKIECIDIFEKGEEKEIWTKWSKKCPGCGKNQFYSNQKYLNRAIKKNSKCRSCSHKKRRLSFEEIERRKTLRYIKKCPDCKNPQEYTSKGNLIKAIKNNVKCKDCENKRKMKPGPKKNKNGWTKICPTCKKIIMTYKNKESLTKAIKNNTDCDSCSYKKRSLSPEEKEESKKRKKEWDKKYWQKNKHNPEYIKKRREYNKKRNKDPMRRLNGSISSAIKGCLKSNNLSKNRKHWETLTINTLQEIIEHLEKNFLPGMSRKNYGKGGWHIHHITPVAFFRFTNIDDIEFKYMWSTDNLTPLWEEDNLEKRDIITFWGKEIKARSLYKTGTTELKIIPDINI